MTTATAKIERSGSAIRAALAKFAPVECARFETEFRDAVTQAGDQFDLAPVDAVLDRWWGVAAIRANPLTEEERDLVARARAGDDSGWASRESDRPASR